MTDLVIIVPSRGRPEAAAALARVFADTCTANTRLLFAVDEDDPSDYGPLINNDRVHVRVGANTTMVEALNRAATEIAADTDAPFAVGFMGDDHCPRTYGWDAAYLEALRELGTGIVYGDDLLQGERLPTQVAMTSDIVKALGYMSPPELRHMYVDNFWLSLGRAAGCIRYLPEVVIEHRHPLAGKAEWDDGYRRVNDRAVYQADETAFAEYVQTRLSGDVATVQALGVTEQATITVLVSRELIDQLHGEWSEPVQVQIIETPGAGTGWEMICRTYPRVEGGVTSG